MNKLASFAKKCSAWFAIALVTCSLVAASPAHTNADNTVQNPAPAAKVSFTFDDGQASAYTQAAPTLAQYGLSGTNYVITGCAGMTTVPNTCRANTGVAYMSWAQIQALQSTYGWEIGSHTVDHDCLASNATADPSDCQKSTLTKAQVDTELSSSKAALTAHGINATAFAPPYGDYSNMVMAEVAKYYTSMRGFKEQGTNAWPLDDYLLNNMTVLEKTDTVATVEAKIDQAINSKTWIILTFHDIEQTPSQKPTDYQYGTAELAQIAAYVKAKQDAGLIRSVNVSQGLVTSSTNLLANGSFSAGMTNGWHTDDPADITADSGNNGSYPEPANAVKLVSNPAGTQGHLFSPVVNVNQGFTYLFKNFLNVQAISSGEVAFYVDEYNANGDWISGQYLKREVNPFVEDMNFTYTPSSANVSKASLQVIVAGTGITAYLDSAQLFTLNGTAEIPNNLIVNGTFDQGINSGWSTDAPATITADSGNNGSPNNPINSVKLVAAANNTHLFSPLVPVTAGGTYSISSYLNVKALVSGEVAYYIDEYDTNGTWISGQYKLGVHVLGATNASFGYTPTSANVARASLQVIVVGNSGITAYVDDVSWYPK
ncbi:MAG TPA: polysaccharide deacetylase family protein [Candidatus Saccharimonadales bacterium]|nr:polysaccharide deacetylase family protein [Candidatus Saccharimonadales bacterium]